ncbi:MAG: transglutaminase domain-containing protein, partial [Verrucomicrobiaceae bacterium]
LIAASAVAVGGQRGLHALEDWLNDSRGSSQGGFDPFSVYTRIGVPGEVNLSPEIVWRIQPPPGVAPPRLLRTASYNTYRTSSWAIEPSAAGRVFTDLSSRIFEQLPYFITTPEADEATQLRSVSPDLPRFTLRGGADEETPLPLPGDAASLKGFELDGIEGNAMGTIRIFPKHSVVEGTVLWKSLTNPESPPSDEDLYIPKLERDAVRKSLRDVQLDPEVIDRLPNAERPTLREKLAAIQAWMQREFSYSRQLGISSSTHVSTSPTAITQFLRTERRGHCEYFASATVLMLRDAGIPARYAIGYATMERDVKRGEFIIRGTHGHAWCRVWDETTNAWIDFDTTPSVWSATVPPPASLTQRFNDWLQL